MPARGLSAVLFDLDGALVGSAPDLHAAPNELLAEPGRPSVGLNDVRAMIGGVVAIPVERAVAATGPLVGRQKREALVSRFLTCYEPQAAASSV